MEPYRSWQSVCRFSLPFLLPLLVAASRCRLAKQNHCAVQYCRRRDCRCRAEFGKFGFFCSLFTIHYSLRSRCRLAKQNNCAVQYCRRRDCRCRRNRGVEIGFITHHSSFIIHLPLLTPRHPGSFQSGASVLPQSSVLSPQSCVFKLPVPAPVINCYFGESNPQLSIKSVCCAIGPCICPVFTGITVKMKRFWLQFGGVKSPGGAILPANRRCLVEFGKFGFFGSLFTAHCSLLTVHCSLRSRCRLAKHILSIVYSPKIEGLRVEGFRD